MLHYVDAAAVPLAPALPAAGEGLAALFPLIAWGICLSLLYVWRRTVGAMIEHLANLLDRAAVHAFGRTIHFLGPVSAGLRDIDGAIQAALDAGARATERATVYLFHKSLATFQAVGRELYHIAEDAGRALDTLIIHTIPHLVKVGIHRLEHEVKQQLAFALKIEHALVRPLERFVHRLEATVERDFGLAHRGIDRVGSRVGRLERTLRRDAARLSRVEKELGIAALTATVVTILSRLGLKWLRCRSLGRSGSKIGCKGFASLERLIDGALELAAAGLAYFAVVDPLTIARAAVKAEDEMESLIRRLAD